MDLVLDICDTYFLDTLYANLIPAASHVLSATVATNETLSGLVGAHSSKWADLVSYLPRPQPSLDSLSAHQNALFSTSHTALASAWPRSYPPRQLISLACLTLIGIFALYFIFATVSYYFIFDHRMMRHPRFLKNQVRLEIQCSVWSFPFMMLLTLPWFYGEVRGKSMMYADVADYGWAYLFFSIPLFLVSTDLGVYIIHRSLHHPLLYKTIHKPHHKWLVPTPFASHAFHPVDGYSQSIPYHLFVFLVPLHRVVYLGLFVAINFWTIFIHDSDMLPFSTVPWIEYIVNGPAHHTLHHLYFTVNYGQYFTWADRAGGSYRKPEEGLDPLLEVLAADKKRKLTEGVEAEEVVTGFKEE